MSQSLRSSTNCSTWLRYTDIQVARSVHGRSLETKLLCQNTDYINSQPGPLDTHVLNMVGRFITFEIRAYVHIHFHLGPFSASLNLNTTRPREKCATEVIRGREHKPSNDLFKV